MSIWIEDVPVRVILPRKTIADKKIPLNLNEYRNAHYQILNQAKIIFTEDLKDKLEGLKLQAPIVIRYYLTLGTRAETDVANICSVVDKFFSDALVHYGCIEDDNYKILKGVSFEFSEIDPGNPHVDIEIIEL